MPEQTTRATVPPGPAAVGDAGVVAVAPPGVEVPPSTNCAERMPSQEVAIRNGAGVAGDDMKVEDGTVAAATAEVVPTEPVGVLARAPTAGMVSLLGDSLGPEHVAQARFDNFLSVILHAFKIIGTRFLSMGTRDRIWLSLCLVTIMCGCMMWPILLCLKLDGYIDTGYAVVWIPLWIFNALGMVFFISMISWGKIKAPPGFEEGWTDPYPVSLRTMELCKWMMIVLFQILLVLRLDEHISASWLEVMSPLLVWACVRMFGYIYKVHLNSSWLGQRQAFEAIPTILGSCVVIVQLTFIILKLDEEADWNWWIVFIPVWVVYCVTFCCSCCSNFAIQEEDDRSLNTPEIQPALQHRRIAATASVQFQRTAHPLSSVWIVTLLLAVAAIEGAGYSTFVIFIPQFLASGLTLCVLLGCICCCRANIMGVERPLDETSEFQG